MPDRVLPQLFFFLKTFPFIPTATDDPRNREVSEDEARAWAEFNNIPFVETSAKSGLNVEDTFAILTQLIYDRIESGEYKLDDGWDGIKRGYYGALGNRVHNNNPRHRYVCTLSNVP